MLQTAIEVARQAGQAIGERYPAGRTIRRKGYRDVVTETDAVAEAIILDLIRERFPDHAILSEEAGGDPIDNHYAWVVDPLDGTTNFAHRIPLFAVSIALLEEGEPIIGVIHDPLRDQTFVAERGEGSRVNGTPLRVSQVTDLDRAVVGLDWGHSDEVRAQMLAYLQEVAPRCYTMRALGCAALALAYVAAGWLDSYANLALKPWDTAAGILLITEAGGRCSALDGGPYRVDLPGCLATNDLIHEESLTLLQASIARCEV